MSVLVQDAAAEDYRRRRIEHWDGVARSPERSGAAARFYHRRLAEIYRFLVPQNRRVIELGSGTGDLLASLKPSLGVGVDVSEGMIERAWRAHPELRFVQADAHEIESDEPFDFVILSDLIHDVWDLELILGRVARLCTPRTWSDSLRTPAGEADSITAAGNGWYGRGAASPDLLSLVYRPVTFSRGGESSAL